MPTSIISGTVVDPSGTPQASTAVRARLVPKGATRISDNSTISEIESTTTNSLGNWSLTLEEQSNISPANSYYAVEEVLLSSSYNQYAISVPAADSNVEAVKIGFVTPGTPLTSLPILPGSHAHPEYEESTEITAAVTAHEGAANPHTVYATDADLTAHAATSHGTAHPDLAAHDTLGLATQVELDAHAAAVDPHPTYHTAAEVATDITTHAGLADPHTGYQKESEKGAVNGYASLDASTLVPVAQLATGAPSGTKFLRDDRTWVVPVSGVSIPQQDNEPAGSVANDLWIDTNEGAGVGLSSILAYAEVTANQGSITTETDLTGLAVTVTVPAGRRVRIKGHINFQQTSADVRVDLNIKEGSTVLQRAFSTAGAAGVTHSLEVEAVISPAAAAHTYKLAAVVVGAGTATMIAGADFPAYILVEDITGTLWPVGQSIGAGTIASEEWPPWTPTFTNFTLGNGTLTAKYQKIGRTVHWYLKVILGSTSVMGSSPTFTLPMASSSMYNNSLYDYMGTGWIMDSGTAHHPLACHWASSTALNLVTMNAAGAYVVFNGLNATTPMSWVSGDMFACQGTYEAAA